MEFQTPHQDIQLAKNFQNLARRFELNPEKLKVEFYSPQQAIVIEEVDNYTFKIHINLQENRIISVQRLKTNGYANGVNGNKIEKLKEKYRKFMK